MTNRTTEKPPIEPMLRLEHRDTWVPMPTVPSNEQRRRGDRAEWLVREAIDAAVERVGGAVVDGTLQEAIVDELRERFRFEDRWTHGTLAEAGLVVSTYDGSGTDHYRSELSTRWEPEW